MATWLVLPGSASCFRPAVADGRAVLCYGGALPEPSRFLDEPLSQSPRHRSDRRRACNNTFFSSGGLSCLAALGIFTTKPRGFNMWEVISYKVYNSSALAQAVIVLDNTGLEPAHSSKCSAAVRFSGVASSELLGGFSQPSGICSLRFFSRTTPLNFHRPA